MPAVEATTPTTRKTALNAVHRQMGARMVEFNGWDMPVEYPSSGGIIAEHMTVRTGVGIFDVSHMGDIRLAGPQALAHRVAACGGTDTALARELTRHAEADRAAGRLAQASDLRLRVIVTARATGAAHALMTSPLLRRFNDLQATTLMLSGNPVDGGKIRGQRFDRLPAGRAILLGDSETPTYVQLVNPRVDESVAVDGR